VVIEADSDSISVHFVLQSSFWAGYYSSCLGDSFLKARYEKEARVGLLPMKHPYF